MKRFVFDVIIVLGFVAVIAPFAAFLQGLPKNPALALRAPTLHLAFKPQVHELPVQLPPEIGGMEMPGGFAQNYFKERDAR